MAIKIAKGRNLTKFISGERDILKRLRSEYFPRVFDFHMDYEGNGYLIMDYIEGCDLGRYIHDTGALNPKNVLIWLKYLCQIVGYLHEHEIIHGDIKPSNIMITPENKLVLLDFGLSYFKNNNAKPIGFTRHYSAPECIVSGVPDVDNNTLSTSKCISPGAPNIDNNTLFITTRSDIYSIGAVGYFMLTGDAPPFKNSVIPSLSDYDYKIRPSKHLCQSIARCLRLNPDERFATVWELEKSLNSSYRIDYQRNSFSGTLKSLLENINIQEKFCENCGSKLLKQASFCHICGVPVADNANFNIKTPNSTENDLLNSHDGIMTERFNIDASENDLAFEQDRERIPVKTAEDFGAFIEAGLSTNLLIKKLGEKAEKEKSSIFVSYAHQDRAKVISAIQGMKAVNPDLDIFMDLDSLRSGDYWEEKLENELKKRDKLYLFWSRSAQKSKWVEREWKLMLSNKGLDHICPIQIENPNICPPPPEELSKKQFRSRETFFYPLS